MALNPTVSVSEEDGKFVLRDANQFWYGAFMQKSKAEAHARLWNEYYADPLAVKPTRKP